MVFDDVLSGDQLTGRQATVIFFAWLTVVIAVGIVMLVYTRAMVG
ncbi:hypothetical protein [Natrialba sp. INN-245]|nr:hypothetical protein [Natrialba sp. INN-245]